MCIFWCYFSAYVSEKIDIDQIFWWETCSLENSCYSRVRHCPWPSVFSLVRMDTFNTGSAWFKNHSATAWPASWYTTILCSFGRTTWLFLSEPSTTRSTTRSKCISPMGSSKSRAAIMATSLQMLAMSALVKPGVMAANLRVRSLCSSSPVFRSRRWLWNTAARPLTLGGLMTMSVNR